MNSGSWLDRAVGAVAPAWQLRRVRARLATELVLRHYEGASGGRRTKGWQKPATDANSSAGPYVGLLRNVARELVRNNPHAESALSTIVDHVVGWGIVPKPKPYNERAAKVWADWAGTTACDADGRNDMVGLQKLVTRTVFEAGEVLVRRRFRFGDDSLPMPLQVQILEPDFLDTSKHGITTPTGGRIVYGVEYDATGRRVAYWLYREHPGNASWPTTTSDRIPAEGIQHIFKPIRPGQSRGTSSFAPVILRMKDFDEYEDATLVKQKISACLAVITSDVDGSGSAIGVADDTDSPGIDMLEPGMIMNVPPGRNISVVEPPSVRDYDSYAEVSLRAIAAGLGVTYEDLTGDYGDLPFSAARMSRIRHWARVDDWRWRVLVPQFCDPVWKWAMQAAVIQGLTDSRYASHPAATWTAPPMPMIEPDKEALAVQRAVRSGMQSMSDSLRERGYDPTEVFEEMAADAKEFDRLGLVLDSDPRYTTQNGQLQGAAAAKFEPKEPAVQAPPAAKAKAAGEGE